MGEASAAKLAPVSGLPAPRDHDLFVRTFIRELAGTLEDMVGLREASGFIGVAGNTIGSQTNRDCEYFGQ